jgi:hypothetical protein
MLKFFDTQVAEEDSAVGLGFDDCASRESKKDFSRLRRSSTFWAQILQRLRRNCTSSDKMP